MQSYDIIMLVVFVGTILFGAVKGLAWQVASLSALFLSYFVALNFYQDLAPVLSAEEPWNRYLAMMLLYLGTSLAIWVVFGIVRRVIDRVALKDFDRHLGAVLGAVNGLILCMVITLFAVTLLKEKQKEAICSSRSGYIIANVIEKIRVGVPEDVRKMVKPLLDRLDHKLHDHDADGEVDGDTETKFADDSENLPIVVTGQSESLDDLPRTLFERFRNQ